MTAARIGQRTRRSRLAVAGLLALVTLLTAGCASGSAATDGTTFHGTVLSSPLPLPQVTLTGPGAAPYDIGATDGQATLMYFGYTKCPDICSVDMATIAGALRRLPATVQQRVRVLFVTTDPERDDPATLATWLGRFDSSLSTKFVGLTGTADEVEQAQRAVNLPVAEQSGTLPGGGDYAVAHAGVVVAFGADGVSRLVYLQGTSLSDYVADLPLLVDGAVPAPPSGEPTEGLVTGTGAIGDVTVIGARARPAENGLTVSLTLSLVTSEPDTLLSVSSSSGQTSLVDRAGAVAGPVPIPADEPTVLSTGGTGIRIAQTPDEQAATGSSVQLALTFERSGTLLLDVPVIG